MKKRKHAIIKDKKLRGEWAELCFMVRAAEHGLQISKPWGEMRSYDFVLGRPGFFVAVQVKSTIYEQETGYNCTVRGGHTCYPPGSFDFLAAYVVLEDAWYIIPEAEVAGLEAVALYPNSQKSKYERFREAWHLLKDHRQPSPRKPIDLQASADERPSPDFPIFWVEAAQPVAART
ncbi:MAG TPA: group I intron-associated PD-(D/E)XK endonuclease [Candidatus Sulfotelmatobacter sp.]|nr:group I intron-associated PD-(D/E)XK endonuclease [Candidatus Sulfotelmatobacter sp.]